MSQFTLTIYTPQELNHASNPHTAFFELAHTGVLDVCVKLNVKSKRGRLKVDESGKVVKTNQAYPKASYYELTNHDTQEHIRFAFDLYDFDTQFSLEALKTCDWVFKRCYNSKYITHLPETYQKKIQPYGLNFGVRSAYHKGKAIFFLGLLLSRWRVYVKPNRNVFKNLYYHTKWVAKHWQFINTTRLLSQFEAFTMPKTEIVMFQTRCFKEAHQDVINIHTQRYQIIKRLQREFPKRFQGGFIASEVANTKYADALTNVPSEPLAYLQAMKHANIVVYTRGLANSPAWKLAEYLSQGKVIIAERLTSELPVPLEHGKQLLYFDTLDNMVHQINLVLEDKELAQSLSKHARQYFENNVHPVKNINRILDLMIKPTNT
ncbi:glycosyltransferase [Mangrovimonas cancribranchiae]|uniref:Glycosyltransferase n=1 Tax=Mangrovimonas cancribranchiae TaxID=3080055 RepID=A0AAU6P199_9FLAO